MKFLTSILSFTLILVLWSCSGTKSESKQEMADSESPKMEETVATNTEEAVTNDLYSVKVLKGDIPSPMKELSAKMGAADVKIVYGSPSVKGRKIGGGLIPYDGKVWRMGANECTTFEVSQDVEIGGQTLPAGKYGFFTQANENEWTFIFNSVHNQWGAYEYDANKDVLRVTATPQASDEMSETMEFKRTDDNTLAFHWENIMVPFAVAVKVNNGTKLGLNRFSDSLFPTSCLSS